MKIVFFEKTTKAMSSSAQLRSVPFLFRAEHLNSLSRRNVCGMKTGGHFGRVQSTFAAMTIWLPAVTIRGYPKSVIGVTLFNYRKCSGPEFCPGAGSRIDTDDFPPGVPQAMAHDSKRGFFSSLFGNRKQKEQDEAAELELKRKLEERIQQILAERVEVPKLEENQPFLLTRAEKTEPEVELLPISASVLPIRKPPVQGAFLVSSFEVPRSYAANER